MERKFTFEENENEEENSENYNEIEKSNELNGLNSEEEVGEIDRIARIERIGIERNERLQPLQIELSVEIKKEENENNIRQSLKSCENIKRKTTNFSKSYKIYVVLKQLIMKQDKIDVKNSEHLTVSSSINYLKRVRLEKKQKNLPYSEEKQK